MKKFLFAVLFASTFTTQAAEPQAEADKLLIEANKLMDAGNYPEAIKRFQRVEALKAKTPEIFAYQYAVALAARCDSASLSKSRQLLDQFMTQVGANGKFFKEAMDQYVKLDSRPSECEALAELERLTPQMVAIPGRNYEIGKYEVTQAQWEALMRNNPSKFKGPDLPVENVSWNDIQEYIQKLNAKTGKQFRLPTADEWLYACWGGIDTDYCGSNNIDAVAWYFGNSGERTHPVGQKKPNAYGLYDMSGNVWEWTETCFEGECSTRMFCGGSATPEARMVRSSSRYWDSASRRGNSRGFRLQRTLR